MPRVMTHCPKTGAAVATNLVMDRQTFDSIRVEGHNFICSSCGDRHVWRSEEAWVDGSKPKALQK